jgi:hypothetical protein
MPAADRHSPTLIAALRDVVAWLETPTVHGIVIGAIAASLHGRARTTADIDGLVVPERDDVAPLLTSARSHGLEPRVGDALDFAQRSRVLLLRHAATGVAVDLTIGLLPFEKTAVDRAVRVPLAGMQVPVPRADDLLVMKAVAGRPRDHVDIEGIVQAHPEIDLGAVTRTVREFAGLLEMPTLATEFEATIRRARDARRG